VIWAMSRRIQPLSIALFAIDFVLVPVALAGATYLRSTLPFGQGGALLKGDVAVPWQVYLLATVCWAVGLLSSGAYVPQLSLRWFNEAWRVAWGALLATAMMAGVLYITYRELSRLQFGYFLAIEGALALGYRAALRLSYRLIGKARPGGKNRILILGAGDLGMRIGKVLLDQSRWGFDPIGYLDDNAQKHGSLLNGLPVLGGIDELQAAIHSKKIDEVWIALPLSAHKRLEAIMGQLERQAVRIKVVPDYFSIALVRANAEILGGIPVIGLRDPLIEGMPRLLKRAFDLILSLLLIILLLPALALIAIFIRLDSPGKALIRQQRVGENGRLFNMLKFRTMQEGSGRLPPQDGPGQDDPGLVHKRRNDPRVTGLGRFLRRYSLDELPQLLNVLMGEMSMVGPRPELPWLVDRYDTWQRKRFAVPQGITGWWQINGRSDKPMHLNTEDDLYYVYNYSIWLDLQILFRTPLAVLSGRGAF
jgi:exopolysaccharide biosynthesis polyprenyl glycosylphosphotransferase